MEPLRALADLSIRRASGFAGLAIGTVMLALSFDLGLSLRTGGALMGVLCLALAGAAWRAPRRNARHTELWGMLEGTPAEAIRRLPRAAAQAMVAAALRERLLWHADRFGLAALALWLPGILLRP